MPGGAGMSSLMVAVLEFSRIPSLSHSGSWERPNNMAWTLFCSDVSTLGTCQARQTQFRFQARHSLGSRPDTHSLGYTLQSLYVFVHTKLQGYLPLRFSTNLPPGNCPTLGHRWINNDYLVYVLFALVRQMEGKRMLSQDVNIMVVFSPHIFIKLFIVQNAFVSFLEMTSKEKNSLYKGQMWHIWILY